MIKKIKPGNPNLTIYQITKRFQINKWTNEIEIVLLDNLGRTIKGFSFIYKGYFKNTLRTYNYKYDDK